MRNILGNIMLSDHIRMKYSLEMFVMLDETSKKQVIFQHWPCFHGQGVGINVQTIWSQYCTCFGY